MSVGFPDWTRAYLLIGSHEGELIPVYVDADGKLFAALQGEYQGELRTIALDDAGRISAFVIDSSDAWGQMLSVGNAELAARLGSIYRFNRTGSVVYMNDFATGWKNCQVGGSGTGYSVALAASPSLDGGYSAHLVGGSNSYKYAEVYLSLPLTYTGGLGFQTLFALKNNVDKAYHNLVYRKSGVSYDATAIIDISNQKIQIVAKDIGTVTLMEGFSPFTDSASFNYFKLVVDTGTSKYKTLYVQNYVFDIAQYSLVSSTDLQPDAVYATFRVYSLTGQNGEGWLDSIVLTGGE